MKKKPTAICRLDAALLPSSRRIARLLLTYGRLLVLFFIFCTARAFECAMCKSIPHIGERARMGVLNIQGRRSDTGEKGAENAKLFNSLHSQSLPQVGVRAHSATFLPPSHQIPAIETQRRGAPVRAPGRPDRARGLVVEQPPCLTDVYDGVRSGRITLQYPQGETHQQQLHRGICRQGGSSTEPHSAFLRSPNGATR